VKTGDEKSLEIDLVLICGRRPELLATTLASFDQSVFRNFTVQTCYANIDPFAGTPEDGEACRSLIRERFPDAQITMPDTPNFGLAVKSTWSQTKSSVVLHLEDDWVCQEDILPDHVTPLFEGTTTAVKLVHKGLNWNGVDLFHQRRRRIQFFNLLLWKRVVNGFGTSPTFFLGDFLRHSARLMDPSLDPEKQMVPPFNKALNRYLEKYRCRLLPGSRQPELIRDIGRQWRDSRGIEKAIVDGRSVWTELKST
jgi:hypothetical protein